MSASFKNAFFATFALASFVVAVPYQHDIVTRHDRSWPSHNQQNSIEVGKAIYFLTNAKENAVVALPIGKDGMLSNGTVTKTGGAGSIAVNGATGQPSLPDALLGQSALTVVGNSLFAVNAGSNTLTMFSISPSDPTCLTVTGQSMAVTGEFPNTVAASPKHKLVCVGTTGSKAGISCAPFSKSKGLGSFDALRPFDIKQSTPPLGPLNTVSHTFFSLDQSKLLTTVKGDPAVNNTGFLSVFEVETSRNGVSKLSGKDVRSSPNGTAVLFGSAPIPDSSNNVFVTDASFGAAILSLDRDSRASVIRTQAIQGQAATCWSTISAATRSAFVTDVAMNRIVEMSLENASIISQLDLTANGDPGLVDLRSAGNFVYALSPGNATISAAITVLDVSGGQGSMKMAQHFGLAGVAESTAQGMAVLVE